MTHPHNTYEKHTYCGDMLEYESFPISPRIQNADNHDPENPRYMRTDEQREKARINRSRRRFLRKFFTNFGPMALFVTLTLNTVHTCKCYSKKGPKTGIVIIEKSPTRPPKPLSVVG